MEGSFAHWLRHFWTIVRKGFALPIPEDKTPTCRHPCTETVRTEHQEMKPIMDGPHFLGLTSLHAFLATGMTRAQSSLQYLFSKSLARAVLCAAHGASYTRTQTQ
jgi:hypothetical protein